MIATRLTFYGACKNAIDFYCNVFNGKVIRQSLFQDNINQFPMGVSEETKELVYYALLQVMDDNGSGYISMSDSPVLAFTGRPENQGCRDNVVLDVELNSALSVEQVYEKFMKDGAKCNIALCTNENYSKYASFIDKYGICWNVYCK